ncbi:acyl-CoA synthetase [Bradyrhizobium genosp. SA-3]|uniref:acetate--CoA ligase family protein n=1 Tax=Bradyrhizobium genosp. SA-3 TaxID=508868 RepID=UPI00102A5D0F|nr:acetate--CoA ligase family protein [Bradyrhizobium genosp. SA-3]RZN07864.1 acyl-CoA synthetase [Bradyrhizobium genosp. SA-3]
MNKLDRLLRPRSLAVFGGRLARNVIQYTSEMGFAGEIWPVHPTKDEVAGRKAYRSAADLPGVPDAAWVGVNRHLTIEVVRELAERGAGGAVCYAAGFRETAFHDNVGEQLQAELVAAAGAMPIIGPNCNGIVNYADGALLWADSHGGIRLAEGGRGVAVVTQSGSIAANLTHQRRGLPLAFLVTAGNQAQTGVSEIALGLIEDDRVTAIGLHIEGFDSIAGFEGLAARARQLKKPIVAMKAGRSEQSQEATVSHTASLAGSDAASGAFLQRLGIARVESLSSFIETLKLLHIFGPLPGYRISSMSCSGGEASLMGDAAVGRPLYFPQLTHEHRARVQATLGPFVAVANPLDYQNFVWGNEPAMTEIFTAMVSGGFDFNMLVLDYPRSDRSTNTNRFPNARAFEAALKANNAKGAIVTSLPENMPEEYAIDLMERAVVPLLGIPEAMDAIQAASTIGAAWREPLARPVDIAASCRSRGERITLDEAGAKAKLIEAGLAVPEGKRAGNAADAVAAAQALGFPVALKALGVAHKSEAGAVRLNLKDAEAVGNAAKDLSRLGSGLYVERMVREGVAELIIGFTRDPVFGAVMTLGAGGVMVELLRDSVTLLLPATREDINAALRGLKLYPLLKGYRGRPMADVEAAIDAMVGIAEFVRKHADEIEELDVNPLIVCAEGAQGKGAWIADALLVLGNNKGASSNG